MGVSVDGWIQVLCGIPTSFVHVLAIYDIGCCRMVVFCGYFSYPPSEVYIHNIRRLIFGLVVLVLEYLCL